MQSTFIEEPNMHLEQGDVAIAIAFLAPLLGLVATFFHESTWRSPGAGGTIATTTEGWGAWAGFVLICNLVALTLLLIAMWRNGEPRSRVAAPLAGAAISCLIGALVSGLHWHALRAADDGGNLALAGGLPIACAAATLGLLASLNLIRSLDHDGAA